MKPKIHTVGVTFYTTQQMYNMIKEYSDVKMISNSELIRFALEYYFSEIEQIDVSQEN